jgi:hypothetical protein
VRLVHRRHPPAQREPRRQTGLGAVRVHQFGPYLLDQACQPPYLARQTGTRGPARGPVADLGAQIPEARGERAPGTAGRDRQTRRELGPYQVEHDPGHTPVDGLREVQDPGPDGGG